MHIFSAILLVVLAVYGAATLIIEISRYFLSGKKDAAVTLITPVKGNCENAEHLLLSAVSRAKRERCERVICLDCDMSEETRKICENISKRHSLVEIMSREDLQKLLS